MVSEHWHGTENGYGNRGCRCDRCRVAHAEVCRVYQARKRREAGIAERVPASKLCLCPGCGELKRHIARGMCKTCYDRWRSGGESGPSQKDLEIREAVHHPQFAQLPEHERRVITLRSQGKTLAEVGELIGPVTGERARQIQEAGLRRLNGGP
jgi:Sigma-70, region 4